MIKTLTPEIEFKVKGYKCSRCGHVWQRRKKDETLLPVQCPSCKSGYWNRPRRKEQKKSDRPINSQGYGEPVPSEMDRHMVKYVVGLRKTEMEKQGLQTLLETEPQDHSDVFYAVRTHLNQLGWDTSVYNDNTVGGSKRRKKLYEMIKPICEKFYKVKRHEIGIFPDDRAVMTFEDSQDAVSFNALQRLMGNGTDVLFVEKQGTVMKMSIFAKKVGLAFIDSQGFGSEYGIALAMLCDQQKQAAKDYTMTADRHYYTPLYRGNLASLTDCDASGIAIGIKISGATRIGIDLNTIQEINAVNHWTVEDPKFLRI